MDRLRAVARTFWVGGIWMVGLMVAPVLFASLNKVTAGLIAGKVFASVAWIGLGCGVF